MIEGQGEPDHRRGSREHQPLDLLTFFPVASAETKHERCHGHAHDHDEQQSEDQPRSVEEGNETLDRVGVGTRTVERVGVVVPLQGEADRPEHREYNGCSGERAPSRRWEVSIGEEEEREGHERHEDRDPDPVPDPRGEGGARRRRVGDGRPPRELAQRAEHDPCPRPHREVDPAERVLRLVPCDHEPDRPDREEGDDLGEAIPLRPLAVRDPECRGDDDARDPERPQPPRQPRSHPTAPRSTGRRPATAVPSPGAEVTTNSPPRAASRSATPCRPVP